MSYNNKLVCSVKANGKFLREDIRENESIVYLPFKTEYSLLLKNLASRRALVHVDIDGKCQTEGGLILDVGQSIDLERPASLSSGRKFKFIEKTAEISNFRGDHPEDGQIFVKWQFEKPAPAIFWNNFCPTWTGQNPDSWTSSCTTITSKPGSAIGCSNTVEGKNITYSANAENNNFVGYYSIIQPSPSPQGITVEGSKSNQNFSSGYIGNLEGTLYSMVIKLYGGPRPNFVREKIQCSTCGRRWKSTFEFCPNCGTAIK